jgi:hypothetical protein
MDLVSMPVTLPFLAVLTLAESIIHIYFRPTDPF